MPQHFDFIIVGRGMMGAAAARHLAHMTGARIALVGPDEPVVDWSVHDGVFASHYDSGRITRTVDPDPVWARLANRSIARYREIEEASGVAFYSETGCLIAGPDSGPTNAGMQDILTIGDGFGLGLSTLDAAGLRHRFPWFSLGDYRFGILEGTGAGTVDPRKMVQAQTVAAVKAGVTVFAHAVSNVSDRGREVEITTADGQVLSADKAMVAAGGFSIAPGLMSQRLDLVVKARTVVLAEIDAAQAAKWAGMPSLIIHTDRREDDIYFLPPVRYPDGKLYIKIGGDPFDVVLDSEAEVRDWFRSGDNPEASAHLEAVMRRIVPGLAPISVRSARCVTTFTRHTYPYIGFAGSDRIAVLTGGNGKAAKSSDEIGRLGAHLLANGSLDGHGYATDFAVHFR